MQQKLVKATVARNTAFLFLGGLKISTRLFFARDKIFSTMITPIEIQMTFDDLEKEEELEGKIFELFEKTPNREFKSHVQFIRAENLCEAEDKAAEVDPDYWKNKSVRPVSTEYAWRTFTQLYFSYNMAKSVLGLEELLDGNR